MHIVIIMYRYRGIVYTYIYSIVIYTYISVVYTQYVYVGMCLCMCVYVVGIPQRFCGFGSRPHSKANISVKCHTNVLVFQCMLCLLYNVV